MQRIIFFLAVCLSLAACRSVVRQEAGPPGESIQPRASLKLTKTPSTTSIEPPTALSATSTPGPAGDLGWRKVKGVVYAGKIGSGHELAGALVKCSQISYVPRRGSCAPYEITTGAGGAFTFDVFVHDTDGIDLSAQKSDYKITEHRIVGLDCVASCPMVELVLLPE